MTKKKIKILNVTPETQKGKIFNRNCFIAISLTNKFFYGEKLNIILNYLFENFHNCLILIADDLYRHNVSIEKKKYGQEALEEARKMGRIFKAELQSKLKIYPDHKFIVKHWIEFTDRADYRISKRLLEDLMLNNSTFNKSIINTANEYLDRLMSRIDIDKNRREECLHHSIEFLLEEMAVYNLVVKDGFEIDIYPGSYLPVLHDISKGIYRNSPKFLAHKVNVEIKLVKKGR